MLLKRLWAGTLWLLLLACGPAAEGPPPEGPRAAGSPRIGGTLVTTSLTDIDTVNDLISNGSQQARDVDRFLFIQLARENDDFKSGPSTFAPRLAERWEFSDDGRDLTFHLRAASWSDGTPITADDVRWTWQAQTDPRVAWRHRLYKESIEDVEAIDSRTVRFHFTEPYPDMFEHANVGAILPKHVWGALPFSEWRSAGPWFAEHIVSSGPFVLESWRPNEVLTLRRNERYYREGFPRLDRLVIQIIPEKAGQISQLLGGSIDYVQVVPPDQIGRIESREDVEIDAYWGRQIDYLCWNTRHGSLGSPALRRALTRAIDRQAIVDSIYRGYARVGISAILSSTWAFDKGLEPWPYGRAEAERMLSESGFVDADGDGVLDRGDERLTFELLIQSGNQVHRDASTLIQAQLMRVGVELTLRPVEFQTFVGKLQSGDFEVAIAGWEIPSSLDMTFAFHTDESGKFNFGSYSNPELDRLLDAARSAPNLEEKRRLLHLVQGVLHREQPYTFLWEPQKLNARQSRVRDSRPNALTSFYNIDDWWLDR